MKCVYEYTKQNLRNMNSAAVGGSNICSTGKVKHEKYIS